ncbi:diguanylate cyclase, partial [Escherichia coli]
DWVREGEEPLSAIAAYLGEIRRRYNTVASFFVSDATRRYYYADGVLKPIDHADWRDAWYFRVRDMEAAYEINVDPDFANQDALTIFVNYRVL